MRKILAFLMLLFLGCSVKDSLGPAFKHDPLYEKALAHTKRCQILNSLETKAIIDATYLNPLYKQFKTPTFLIGVYNEFNNTINNVEFNLTINNQQIEINSSIPEFVLYKEFPFYNSWMNYYLVKVKSKPPFKIIYHSKHWGECKLLLK
ncbi:MAG: hypothetical protein ABGX23_03685 [Nautiliaceae bacterium]